MDAFGLASGSVCMLTKAREYGASFTMATSHAQRVRVRVDRCLPLTSMSLSQSMSVAG